MFKINSIRKMFNLFLFVSLFALLCSCIIDTAKKTYTITFEVNDEVISSVEVAEGATLTVDQVPDAPKIENYVFDGWFNGTEEFNIAKVHTENTNYVAKLTEVYTIKFVIDGNEIKTVNVLDGEKFDILSVPEDPILKAHAFVGWFDGEEQFDELADVIASKTYEAKFEKTHNIVTFKNGDEVVEVLVGVNDVLSLEEITNPFLENAYFAGWYAGDVLATDGMTLEDDITFEAKFVTIESFNGTWYNVNGEYFIIENGKVVGGEFGENGQTFTFNVENGTLKYESDGFYLDESTFEVTADSIKFTHKYYDGMYEEIVIETVELVLATDSKYEGTYRASQPSIITIIEGGIVTEYDGTTTIKGIIKEVEGQIVIVYTTSVYIGEKTVNVVFDELGNLVAENQIYVKNSTNFSYLYNSYDQPTFNFFEVNGNIIVTVKEDNTYYYGSVEGNIVLDEIITVTYNDKSVTCKVAGDTLYELAGEEKGVYTSANGTITLNGFGNAVLEENGNTENLEYILNGAGNLVIGNKGYTLDLNAKTYAALLKDSVKNGTYTLSNDSKYTLVFDGFGGANLHYAGSYSTYDYQGKYVLKNNTIVISNCYSSVNGTWTVEENGNVLANGSKVYLYEGATFTDVSEKMDGVYGEDGNIVISSASKEIKYNNETYSLTYNYNGSKATFEIKHKDTYEGYLTAEFTDVLTISLTEAGKLQVENKHYTWDEYGEGATYTIITEEYAPYVASEKDAFAGTWVGKNVYGVTVTIVINGDGTGTYNDGAFTYTISGNKLSFVYNYEDYSLNGDPATGTLSVMWTYDFSDMPEFDVTKQQESTLDAFAGTWVGKNVYGVTVTIVINGDGTGTYNDGAFTYTISGNKLSFVYNYEDYSLNGDPATGTLSVMWTYDFSDMPEFDVTKQQESTLDAFAGTWVGKNVYGVTVTIVINGDGTGTYNDGAFTYTISGNKLSFVYNYEDYSLNGDPATGTLSVMWTYDFSDMPEFDVTKK